MNYKKHKEDLEAAKGWLAIAKENNNMIAIHILEKFFPELKESEDEKIRKEIIQFLQLPHPQFVGKRNHEEWIAWLEKQGEKSDYNPYKATVESISAMVEKYASFDSNLQDFYDNVKVKCKDAMEYDNTWLEKQDEQKTEIEYIYPKFRIGDVIEPIKPNGNSRPVRVLSICKKTKSYCCESDDHNVYSSIPIRCENEYKLVEQKPAEWSEEDERMCQETIDWFEKKCFPYALESENPARESIKWLKSLKDRVQPQPKQEWSEKDEKMLNSIIEEIRPFGECPDYPTDEDREYYYNRPKMIDWLKSLKPQNRWKPSEAQMRALELEIIGRRDSLYDLYYDLQKL